MVSLVQDRDTRTTGNAHTAGTTRATLHIRRVLFATVSIYALSFPFGLALTTASHANDWIGTN
ncbi:hypothetical protein, partial [Streptococcus pneumoniae]|uniref:hypothetical protein n=1 Tax=Streptococcus pneumoniae TaxID=1313 RepID=UPI001954047C